MRPETANPATDGDGAGLGNVICLAAVDIREDTSPASSFQARYHVRRFRQPLPIVRTITLALGEVRA
jgi:hypothetical protein